MDPVNDPKQCATIIKSTIGDLKPTTGLILGSGLNEVADAITDAVTISFDELPGFAKSTVEGHCGQLVIGFLNNVPTVCLQGRVHYYEQTPAATFKTMIRTLKCLGIETLIITNAAGSLRAEVLPGSLMLVHDHINFTGFNPLIGPNDDEFGPRFVPMEDAYDPQLRQQLAETAMTQGITLHSGVYVGVAGPMFETPAEINAFRILGANAVGMSTVPEVITARHCGLKVACISAITNLAAGMSEIKLSHELTLAGGKMAFSDLTKLLLAFMGTLKS